MKTTEPNDRVGTYYTDDPSQPKATVTTEVVTNCQSILEGFYGMGSVCDRLDNSVRLLNKSRKRQHDALLVLVNPKGEYYVYDNLAQRGGKGLKKKVEVHRLKLFIALIKALPGLCTDLLSFLSSQIDEEPHPTTMPLNAISSKAAYKMLPESIKKLYSEIQTIQI